MGSVCRAVGGIELQQDDILAGELLLYQGGL